MSIAGKWFGFGRDADYDEGMRSYDRGMYAEAAQAFQSCLQRSTDPATVRLARFYLGETFARLAEDRVRSRRFDEAVNALESALELQPNYPDNHFRLAIAYGLLGDAENETRSLERALKINPRYAQALLLHGTLLLEAGKVEEGWKDIEKAVAIDPGLSSNSFQSALACRERGDHSRAAQHLRSIIGAEKNDANHHAALGDDLVRQRRFEESLAEYQLAVGISPNYPDIRCRFAQALMELGMLAEAEEQLQVALKVNPRYVEAWAQLGICLKRLGREAEAKDAFRKAAEIDPLHVIASQELSRLG